MVATITRLLQGKKPETGYIFPFLWLHGESEGKLREYMRAIHEANIDAVCVESRPHPDFLGEKWWKDLDVILDEARNRNMKVWILDDSHFPTGFANGALQDADETLCRQSLVYQIMGMVTGGQQLELRLDECARVPEWQPNMMEQYTMDFAGMRKFHDVRFVGVAAVKIGGTSEADILDLTDEVKQGTCSFIAPDGQWRIYALNLTRNRGPHRNYINMMSAESCKVLLDTVYEAHWQHYQKDFGTTIAGFFSDEPEIGNGHLYESGKRFWEIEDQAWSPEVEREIRNSLGERFVKMLPLLWEQEFDQQTTADVRNLYMDIVTKAVKRNFSEQLGDWCRGHGVEYIGHLIEDNNQHLRCGSSLGHYFRGLYGQDMAGIDCIGGQVLPQGEWDGLHGLMGEYRSGPFYHYVLGTLGSSLAAIDPKKKGRCMCEIFGNYGWEAGVRLEKYLADHFLVQGVNHFVPHAFSPKEFPDPDCPPHFYAHGNNPQYRHFGALMEYMNRVCQLISGGKQDAPVAILYTAESDWAGECMHLETVAEHLAKAQIGYHIIPADVFTEPEAWNASIGNGLHVNGQQYRLLLIPGCDYLPSSVRKMLPVLMGNGCNVYFVGSKPENMTHIPVLGVSELREMLKDSDVRNIRLMPENGSIRVLRYMAETERYLFVNEGTQNYTGTIHLPSSAPCYAYNAWDNRLEEITYQEAGSGTELNVTLEPGKSLIIIFDDGEEKICKPVTASGVCEVLNSGWKRSVCRALDYPAFGEEVTVTLPDQLAEEKPLFSGFVRYDNEFLWNQADGDMILEITDAYEGVEVFVNGISLGIQIAAPFCYDLTRVLKKGKNQIRIEVATTLEREMSTQPDLIRQYLGLGDKKPVCPSGINGEVRVWKQ